MLDFSAVWNKICDEYVEDYENINYRIAEKGHGCSNKPKTLYIEISAEEYAYLAYICHWVRGGRRGPYQAPVQGAQKTAL